MLIFNLVGLVMIFVALGSGALVQAFVLRTWDFDAGLTPLVGGALALVIDFIYRAVEYPEQGGWRFVKPTTGGQLMLLPVWTAGLFFIFLGIHDLETDRRGQVVEHRRFVRETVEMLDEAVQELVKIDTRAGWIAAQDRVERCRQRLRELGPFFENLDRTERRQLDKRYGHRLTRAAERLREEAARLNHLPAPARPEGVKVQ